MAEYERKSLKNSDKRLQCWVLTLGRPPLTWMCDHFCVLPSMRFFQKFQIIQVIQFYSRYTQTFYPFRIKVQRDHLLQPSCYLGGGPSAGPSRRLPGPLLGDAVDIVAPPSGRVRVLLPKVIDLERLLTRGRAGRLRLRQTLLWLHFGVKRGVLPGQLGQVRLCRHLGRKN